MIYHSLDGVAFWVEGSLDRCIIRLLKVVSACNIATEAINATTAKHMSYPETQKGAGQWALFSVTP